MLSVLASTLRREGQEARDRGGVCRDGVGDLQPFA
jgi:hypothetical protein